MSEFGNVKAGAPIEVFQKKKMYDDCTDSRKINLTVGAYRTETGQPWVLPVVRVAEQRVTADDSLNHEYLPVPGNEAFCKEAVKLVLGDESPAIKEERVLGIQALSGTGALRVAAESLHRLLGKTVVYQSNPTWENHSLVFRNSGFTDVREHRYWDAEKRQIDFIGMIADLGAAPEGAVVILHGCAHNPTGMDPTEEQWRKIYDTMKDRKLFPLFDIAYQGFASGCPDRDAAAVRYFVAQGMEMIICQSFAKNMGLYNERIGNVTVVANDKGVIPNLRSQISLIIRANWSNPPAFGSRIVHMILSTPELKAQWMEHIKEMSGRIKQMRAALRSKLEEMGTPGTWEHITTQIGMFSFTGLNEAQVTSLIEKHKVFLLNSGRINVCGLNTSNVEYVAKAIDDVVRNVK